MAAFNLGACSNQELDSGVEHDVETRRELEHSIAAPLPFLFIAHENRFAEHILKQFVLYQCHRHLFSKPEREAQVVESIWHTSMFSDQVFNIHIRGITCGDAKLDDGVWYSYSFQQRRWDVRGSGST